MDNTVKVKEKSVFDGSYTVLTLTAPTLTFLSAPVNSHKCARSCDVDRYTIRDLPLDHNLNLQSLTKYVMPTMVQSMPEIVGTQRHHQFVLHYSESKTLIVVAVSRRYQYQSLSEYIFRALLRFFHQTRLAQRRIGDMSTMKGNSAIDR